MRSMKALARSYVWWPKLDADIESKVRACAVCQRVRATPTKLPYTHGFTQSILFKECTLTFVKIKKYIFLFLSIATLSG